MYLFKCFKGLVVKVIYVHNAVNNQVTQSRSVRARECYPVITELTWSPS